MTKKYQPSPEQIQEEMLKIGALTHQPYPSSRNPLKGNAGRRQRQFARLKQPGERAVRAECTGHCNGGDTFDVKKPDAKCTNWIKFKGRTSGQEFEYESKKTGTYEMNFQVANEVFDVSFRSTCEDFDKNCDTKVEDGGKKLRLEDETDADYTDLIIVCEVGLFAGRFSKDEKTLTYTSSAATEVDCGEGCECIDGMCQAEEPECKSDEDCPPGHICEDGVCVPGCRTDEDCPPGHICEDGQCVEGCRDDEDCPPGHICKDGQCIPGCRDDEDCGPGLMCVDNKCVDRCPDVSEVWDGERCVCANGYIEIDGECKEQCDPYPPVGGDGDCDDEGDPCFGVTCVPPRECVDGSCECPEGTRDAGNGLCMPADLCWGVLCPPNATCVDGICQCDDGYVLDGETGYCVMSETPDCRVEPEDCCPSNATIQIMPGRGLGGGGSFRLNQPCDKTIMLWVDSSGDDVVDEECNENGQAQVCSCSAEIAALMDLIVELRAELEMIKDQAEVCAEKNDC